MCRIAGIYNPGAANLETDILKMRDSMHRGGPDDAGVFVHPELSLAIGHRRLSLLDLSSAGHQPMESADGGLQIAFNGEIYNFKEIRKELQSLGYHFRTQTDTEVILYSYQAWGKKCFERFNGMFALALWDELQKEIILARDHAGMKPLYYYLSGDVLMFASEIRAFKAVYDKWEPEPAWKPVFLLFGHLPEPFTTLKDVRCLRKGEWMSFQTRGMKVETGRFYEEDYSPKILIKEEALEVLRDLLPKAVERHLISDAPIGLFLSGGIDSSLLTLLAAPVLKNKLLTLSIQFEEAEYSEESYQKIVIDITKTRHSAFKVGQQDFEAHLPDILLAMDQPSIDAINTYFISMYARASGLTAVLSGLGADELLGGYPSFQRFNHWKYLKYVPDFVLYQLSKLGGARLSKLSYGDLPSMISLYLMNRGIFTVEKAAQLTGCSVEQVKSYLEEIDVPSGIDYSSMNANVRMELNLYMKNQLLKDSDYMAMWHGLEIRVPFLDKDLVMAVNSISADIRFGSDLPKGLLIEAFATLLPAEIWCRKKQGFTFPIAQWLKKSTSLAPLTSQENKVFDQFDRGNTHWSTYWATKVAAMEKFN